MLVAAAPTTKKHVSAMMVIALVKPYSLPFHQPRSLSRELGAN
jgi:hypothetical protein